METIRIGGLGPRAPAGSIQSAAALLRAGKLVAFGTETVYGLGADAQNPEAIAALYAAKRRPTHNPLIAHLADAGAAFREGQETPLARAFADRFWPGPLTLVLLRHADSTVCRAAAANLDTIALRVPAGDLARRLLQAVGRPVAAPSANPSGCVSPSTAAHVRDGLDGRIDAILDSGPCAIGLESTVLDLTGAAPLLLRPGAITAEQIQALLDELRAPPLGHPNANPDRPAAPGQLASHYAPALPVRLDARSADANEALLAFGAALAGAGLTWNLSPAGDLVEAATRLFAGLRFLDSEALRHNLVRIAVMPIPAHGLGLAIRDRLRRAAAPR